MLGRAEELPDGVVEGEQICIGQGESTLSRHHAEIDWNEETSSFCIRCTSKNGIIVDKKAYSNGLVAPLTEKSAVRMGAVRFYFITHYTSDVQPKKTAPTSTFEKALSKTTNNKMGYFGKF